MRIVLLCLCLSLLVGCIKKMTPDDVRGVDFGQPPSDYQNQIDSHLENTLYDPYSAVKTCGVPCRSHKIFGGHLGWTVTCQVNAKNRMGGYTGKKDMSFFFNGGKLETDALSRCID